MHPGWCTSLSEFLSSGHRKISQHLNVCNNSTSEYHVIRGSVVVRREYGRSGPGKSVSVQLYSRTLVNPDTGKGKLSDVARLKHGKSSKHYDYNTITYQISVRVEPEFGIPGAIAVTNRHGHEFFLYFIDLEISGDQKIHFDCNSWVYPIKMTQTDRLFFSNMNYLPRETPDALKELRREELLSMRGDGRGERKPWDRIYDYDYYNDLGNPDKDPDHARPVLGGSKEYPYPRRGRTGRHSTNRDRRTESRSLLFNLDVYVPTDERFSPKKFSEFVSNSVNAIVHFLIPEVKYFFQRETGSFESLTEIHSLFSSRKNKHLDVSVTEKLKQMVPDNLFGKMIVACKENSVKFPVPQVVAVDPHAWRTDEEFSRETLAGINPCFIECLHMFPPESKTGERGSSITASHVEKNLEGLTLHSAMLQWRIYILDHHDYLMPYLDRINQLGSTCAYASRTLFFLKNDATLKPLAIELSLPESGDSEGYNQVFLPATEGTEGALWQLAKAHVTSNDSCYHQLISHWLKTHAVVEPFVIATRRQMSRMHPIHKLLDPHFKDTMHINALARTILLNAGGILEKSLYPGKYAMELSSVLYKEWRFDEQALPKDLLKRGMATEAPDRPGGVRLIFDDYPYGADGLEIWAMIKIWVSDYCSLYYPDDGSVKSDGEIQNWWSEIRNVGHGDKRNETWWSKMDTLAELAETLTTLIWTASALHAAVNFGQYGYAGFLPNRPPHCRKFIPAEGTAEFAEFLKDPDKYYLSMLPSKFTATLGIALIEILSRHASEEIYVGQRGTPEWTEDGRAVRLFEKFQENLQRVEMVIEQRNRDRQLKNRVGPTRVPYTLLYPDTWNKGRSSGITGRGVPNSVSI